MHLTEDQKPRNSLGILTYVGACAEKPAQLAFVERSNLKGRAMAIHMVKERTLADVIEDYLRSRKRASWPLSLDEAIKAVRYIHFDSSLSDRDLGNLIAAQAIANGHNLSFDQATGVLPAGSAQSNAMAPAS